MSEIRNIISQWVSLRKMFTSYEVFLATRQKNKTYRSIKKEIHAVIIEIASQNNYSRILREVGAPVPAWIYYPVGENPYNYQAFNRTTAVVSIEVKSQPLLANMTADIPEHAYGTDESGNLHITYDLLKEIGITDNGSSVWIKVNKHKMKIRKFSEGFLCKTNHEGLTIYQCELYSAEMSGKQGYKIKKIGDEIVVSPM